MLPNASPKPRWLISAAMPSPAARPAIGPSQERLAAAAAGAAAAAAFGAAGWAAGVVGRGASGVARGGTLRCMPAAPPPPMRRA